MANINNKDNTANNNALNKHDNQTYMPASVTVATRIHYF